MFQKSFDLDESTYIEVIVLSENENNDGKESYNLNIFKADEENEYYVFDDYYELLTNLWALEERFFNILLENETDRTENELDRLISEKIVKKEDRNKILKYREFVDSYF